MTNENKEDRMTDAFIRQMTPPVKISDERVERLITGVMDRIEPRQPTPHLGQSHLLNYMEAGIRFGLPMAAGLLLGIFAGGAMEPKAPTGLLTHLANPSIYSLGDQ